MRPAQTAISGYRRRTVAVDLNNLTLPAKMCLYLDR
jgi:hypothetical protein